LHTSKIVNFSKFILYYVFKYSFPTQHSNVITNQLACPSFPKNTKYKYSKNIQNITSKRDGWLCVTALSEQKAISCHAKIKILLKTFISDRKLTCVSVLVKM